MTNETRKERQKQYYIRNRAKKLEYQKEWSEKNMETEKEYKRKYYLKNKDKFKKKSRANDLKRKFGITLNEYNERLINQNHCCMICGRHRDKFKKDFAVDHNHATGVIRGLLCGECNTGLGKFRDDVILLQKAINYLNNHNIL